MWVCVCEYVPMFKQRKEAKIILVFQSRLPKCVNTCVETSENNII